MTEDAIVRHLNGLGVDHRAVRFDPALPMAEAVRAIGLPDSATCRTVAVASMPAVVLVVLPGLARLDIDLVRRHLGENRTMPIGPQALERMTGFRPDALTPLPLPGGRRFRVLLDECLLDLPELAVEGGVAGLAIVMTPRKLRTLTEAETATLSAAGESFGQR